MRKSTQEKKEIGLRLKSARSLVALNRVEFCKKYSLNLFTVQAWENGRALASKKHLQQYSDSLASEGVFCSQEWLLDGQGEAPTKIELQDDEQIRLEGLQASEKKREQKHVEFEAEIFKDHQSKLKRRAVVLKIADEAMQPKLVQGDYVGGVLVKGKRITPLLGKICIVETEENRFIVRRLLKANNKFLLIPLSHTHPSVVLNKISAAGKIGWWRQGVLG